jgi:hypothetical protein
VKTPVLGIVANRVVDPPPDPDALRALASANGDAQLAVEAGVLLAEIAEDQAPMLDRLRSLGPPVAAVGLMGVEHHDLNVTKRIAAQLESAST